LRMPFIFNTISEADILRSPGGVTMIDAINYPGNKHQVITGIPGSGKTTVTVMRAAKLYRENKKVLVITYQNMLRISLKNISGGFRNIYNLHGWYRKNAGCFLSTHDDHEIMIEKLKELSPFDEILIDEGQDFEERVFLTLGNF